jgi:hypothetical protein
MVLVKKNDVIPDWLKPGTIIDCGFTGIVQEIATGDETIMVKVESPKRLAFGHTLEWLPFDAQVMKPAPHPRNCSPRFNSIACCWTPG